MVTLKLQNEWTCIRVQEKFEILLCYHTTEGGLICAVFHSVPKQRVLLLSDNHYLSPLAATLLGGWVVV